MIICIIIKMNWKGLLQITDLHSVHAARPQRDHGDLEHAQNKRRRIAF